MQQSMITKQFVVPIFTAGECRSNDVTLELHHILRFTTGADNIPPLGFSKHIDISFFTPIPGNKNYPTSSTCGMELSLPRGVTDESQFCDLMIEAILCSPGFGKL